jgi:holliday junction DNA helicase RuvA
MINYLSGVIVHKNLNRLVLEVSGVGYGVDTLISATLPSLKEKISLWVYTRVKEDEIKLFGFVDYSQREVFEILLEISGVGPKVAMAILSSFSLESLWVIVCNKDAKKLESVPGVGKRTAEKMVLELEAKSKKLQLVLGTPVAEGSENNDLQIFNDLYSALLNLGYKSNSITPVISSLKTSYQQEPLAELIKQSFSLLSSNKSTKKSSNLLTKVF